MFDIDTWQEILDTVGKNKLRTLLTAWSVAWGILMLVVLLGSGQGLVHGVEYGFRDDATNSIWMRSGQTSRPYRGLRPGRIVQFTNEDHATIRQMMPRVDHLTSRFFIRGNLTVAYRGETASYNVRSVHPDHQYLERTIVTEGRFLNTLDIAECRKVAVIGDRVEAHLFKGRPALGEYITVNHVPFRVVGVFNEGTTLATIADMDDMIFEGRVDESEVGKLEPGMTLLLTVGAVEGREFEATLEHIAPKGVAEEGAIQFQIRAALQTQSAVLIRANYSANADIVLDRRDRVLAINESWIEFDGDKKFVQVETALQEFERREIVTGLSDGILIEVVSGLTATDRIRGQPALAGAPD